MKINVDGLLTQWNGYIWSYSISVLSTFILHWNSVIKYRLHYFVLSVKEQSYFTKVWLLKTLHSDLLTKQIRWRNFLRFVNAFDWKSLILPSYLHSSDIQGTEINWVHILTNRKQKVEIRPFNATQNYFSNWDNKTRPFNPYPANVENMVSY